MDLKTAVSASEDLGRTAVANGWRWRQDREYRFTQLYDVGAGVDIQCDMKLGRARWEIPGAMALHVTWAEHQAQLGAWRPFADFRYGLFLDAEPRYLSCSGEPVFGEDGGFIGYRGTTIDITDEVVGQRKQRDASVMLKVAASLGRLGAWSVDLPSMRLTWCDQVRAIHGVPPDFRCSVEEAINFYLPEHRELLRAAFIVLVDTGKPFEDLELQIISATKRRVWVKVAGEAERDASGHIVRVQGAFQDITQIKEAAEQSRQLAQSLAATLESLADGFFALDREWRFVHVNDEACRVLRQSPDQLIGKVLWERFPDAIDGALHIALERALTEHKTVELDDFYPPLGLWFRLRACPSPEGLVVSFVDITAQKAAEARLLEANAELEQRVAQRTAELEAASREMEVLAYAVAHDLRAPLGAIAGYGQMLEDGHVHELSGRGPHFVRRIRAAAAQMDEMTEGVLALARLSGKDFRRSRFDFSELAREIAGLSQQDGTGSKAQFVVEPGLQADADQGLLMLVMGNLIGNAFKFSSKREAPLVEVGVTPAADGEPVYFVRDNGVGFESAYASQLFLPFHRLHGTTEFNGTGIGLAVAYKVIRLHGGHIWAESSPGMGATFYFTLGQGQPGAR